MAKLFKRGNFWWYDFRFQKRRYQGSTFLKNREKADSWIAKFRSDLALGLVGLTHREPCPLLKTFLEGPFLKYVDQSSKAARTKTYYREKVKVLCAYAASSQTRLDAINEQWNGAYKAGRLAKGLAVDTINGEVRTLRKALKYAESCDLIRYRKIKELPGSKNRTYVLDAETERRYLELAEYPLRQVAILMLDLGLRPEEAVSLRRSDISEKDIIVRGGKTPNARRVLPQTSRTLHVFSLCFALFPPLEPKMTGPPDEKGSEWVFPGGKGKHFTRGAISNLHTALCKAANPPFPGDFKLYSCRHTHATRFAESGADVFQIKTRLGHSSVKVSERYIHSTSEHMTLAAKRFEAYTKLLRGESHEDAASEMEATDNLRRR